MNQQQVEHVVKYAIQMLIDNDSVLIDLNVSERALMFHLARYIREKTPSNLDVDCEYNRHLSDKKNLLFLKNKLKTEEEYKVYPDILIHQRNSDEHNILVVEIKKHGEDVDGDKRKLKAFKEEPYFYDFAVQIIVPSENSQPLTFEFV
ncbi:MAG: hypothetical protein WA123_04910 [Methylotenera sp.]